MVSNMTELNGSKTQYTTRMSTALLNRIHQIASDTGASANSVVAMLVSLGLKIYDGEITVRISDDQLIPRNS